MQLLKLFLLILFPVTALAQGQSGYIEQTYFSGKEGRNQAIAAARYAEEAYYYSQQAMNRSALESFRTDLDTVLFFIQKSTELAERTLPKAVDADSAAAFLNRAISLLEESNVVLRHIYPFRELPVMQQYVDIIRINLIHAKIDCYQASLLLGDGIAEPEDAFVFGQLTTDEHVARLDADETAFTDLVLELEDRIKKLNETIEALRNEIAQTEEESYRAEQQADLEDLLAEREELENTLEKAGKRLQEIRELQQKKMMEDGTMDALASDSESADDSQFETDKHGYYNSRDVALNQPLPQGLMYRIQLGYFFRSDGQDAFHGLFPISGEDLKDGKVRYYVGMFSSYGEASRAKDYIRQKRISDAFVVPYYDGKKINVKRAIELEKGQE